MPHIQLDYSANVERCPDFAAFFRELHHALAATEACALVDLKSRAVCHHDYLVGASDAKGADAFVALTLKLLAGRDVSVRQRLLQVASAVLGRHFAAAQASGRCQMSVEICEMERATYTKQWPQPLTSKEPG